MTFSRDKNYDIKLTREMLKKKHQIKPSNQSWLEHKGKAAIIDYELLNGASLEQLIIRSGRKSSAVKAHIYHLKKEHGLNIEKNEDVFKINPFVNNSPDHSSSSENVKIGILVKNYIYKLFHYCEIEDRDELYRLMDKDYSKTVFNINFPFCKPADNIANDEIVRFWKTNYQVNGKVVRVCSQWYASSRSLFLAYLLSKKIISEYEYSNYKKIVVNDIGIEDSEDTNKLKEEFHTNIAKLDSKPTKKPLFPPSSIDSEYNIEEKLVHEAKQMSQYYEVFYSLERSIRLLIENVMESKYGKRWWDTKVDYRVRDNVKRNLEYELDTPHTKRSEHNIDYTTFGDLRKIINTNWYDFQFKFNRNLSSVNEILIDLNRLRVPIAHYTPLAKKEIKRLEIRVDDWFDLFDD